MIGLCFLDQIVSGDLPHRTRQATRRVRPPCHRGPAVQLEQRLWGVERSVPFAGSGTECVAAALSDRRYWGVDLKNPEYVAIARDRIEKARAEPPQAV